MSATVAVQLLVFALGTAWTAFFYLVKRTLGGIDRKMEESLARTEESAKHLKETIERKEERLQKDLRLLAASTARHLRRLNADMARREAALRSGHTSAADARAAACERAYVSRQEFGAFTVSMNHKIDSIYELLKKEEPTR